MKNLITAAATALVLCTTAHAQGTSVGVQTGGYAGPTVAPVITIKDLIGDTRVGKYVRLQGQIVSHEGGENYTFADNSGRMTVEIDAESFPVVQPISDVQRVEILVEVEKDLLVTEFEVKRIRVIS